MEELSINEGDRIEIYGSTDADWWLAGKTTSDSGEMRTFGLVPASYLQLIKDPEPVATEGQLAAGNDRILSENLLAERERLLRSASAITANVAGVASPSTTSKQYIDPLQEYAAEQHRRSQEVDTFADDGFDFDEKVTVDIANQSNEQVIFFSVTVGL